MSTTFQWLIERGQPEGLEFPEWLENSADHPARDYQWTRDASRAAMFPDRDMAETYIEVFETGGRAVEHGFDRADQGDYRPDADVLLAKLHERHPGKHVYIDIDSFPPDGEAGVAVRVHTVFHGSSLVEALRNALREDT